MRESAVAAPLTRHPGRNMDDTMSETSPESTRETPPASAGAPAKPEKKEESFLVFLVKLVLIVVLFRSLVFSPFNIPSESMLPRLVDGDYLLAAKWPYGFSRYSVWPEFLPLPGGRLLASQPKRGDVVIFKAPPLNEVDWIKRVIGLPGDTIQMKGGVLHINGNAVPKLPVAPFEVAVSPNTHCYAPVFEATRPDGTAVCRYPRFHETLPGENGKPGKQYDVLDLGTFPRDDTPPVVVPEATLFLMGDNRDNSMDSRFSTDEGGIGLVPQGNLVGRATIMMWSTDGSLVWYEPWTWFTATRWNRIGGTF